MICAYPPIEARVLVSMICQPELLAVCDSVETGDLVDMHHVVVLWGIRKAQQWGEVNPNTVLDGIEHCCCEQNIPEAALKVDRVYLANLIAKAPWTNSAAVIRNDVTKLREARQFRESLHG